MARTRFAFLIAIFSAIFVFSFWKVFEWFNGAFAIGVWSLDTEMTLYIVWMPVSLVVALLAGSKLNWGKLFS